MIGIYKIKNKINNKVYYGSSKRIEERFKEHKDALKSNNHDNKHLQGSYNNYGDVFEYKIIAYCAKDDLLKYEQYLLDEFFDNGEECYNMNPLANCPPNHFGRKRSIKSKERIRKSKIGNINSIGIKMSTNTSGYVGVCFDKARNKWLVTFREKFIGRYATPEQASLVYQTVLKNYLKGIL